MDKNEPVKLTDIAEALARELGLKYDELGDNSYLCGMIEGAVMYNMSIRMLVDVNNMMKERWHGGVGYSDLLTEWLQTTNLVAQFARGAAAVLLKKETP